MVPERVSAFRLDKMRREMKRVDLDREATWGTRSDGKVVTHIEGAVGGVDDVELKDDGIRFLVEYDYRKPYPYMTNVPDNKYVSGKPLKVRFNRLDLVFQEDDGVYVETLVVFDIRRPGRYRYPVNHKGSPESISKN